MRKILALVTLAVVALVISSAAAGETTRETIPFEATVTDCGNTIQISGEVLAIFTVTESPSGGSVLHAHFQPQNLTGTDELGRRYNGTGLTRDMIISTPAGGASLTFVNRFHLVGTSGAPTFYVKETFHITITPAGEITADVGTSTMECV
jgi:hypothetical protein